MVSKKSIRDDSKMVGEMVDVIKMASVLGAGTDLADLAHSMAHLPDLPDRFNAAFSKSGWFFVEFACSIDASQTALDMLDEGIAEAEIDAFLADNLLDVGRISGRALKALGGGLSDPEFPERAKVTTRAFKAFGEDDFIVATPLLLMLIDGYGVSITGTKSIFSDLDELEHLFEDDTSIGGHWSGMKAVLRTYVAGAKGYSEKKPLTAPNRNGILHGTRLNYDSKVVASKALNLLAGIIEWANDISGEPKDAQQLRDRTQQLLKNKLGKLQPDEPDKAIALLQEAFDRQDASDVVVLIDYEPSITNLRTKIQEWSKTLEVFDIRISRVSDWSYIGDAGDSEQYAKCRIRLVVVSDEGTKEHDVEDELYVKRTKELEQIAGGVVWQVGLNLLGKVRHLAPGQDV